MNEGFCRDLVTAPERPLAIYSAVRSRAPDSSHGGARGDPGRSADTV